MRLTKIHKPTPVGRPIIAGCDDPTVIFCGDTAPASCAIATTYIKDTTVFFDFLEKKKISKDTIVVSMHVSSLYTNILPEEERI